MKSAKLGISGILREITPLPLHDLAGTCCCANKLTEGIPPILAMENEGELTGVEITPNSLLKPSKSNPKYIATYISFGKGNIEDISKVISSPALTFTRQTPSS